MEEEGTFPHLFLQKGRDAGLSLPATELVKPGSGLAPSSSKSKPGGDPNHLNITLPWEVVGPAKEET